MLAAPEHVNAGWLGQDNARLPAVGDLARSLGARDVALALATIVTLEDPVAGSRVQAACAAVDAIDAAATVIARRSLPRRGVIGTVTLAGLAALIGARLSRELARA